MRRIFDRWLPVVAASLLATALQACSSSAMDTVNDPGAGQCGATGLSSDPATVNTLYGPVHGKTNSASLAFLGIPYTKPPVGALRWQPPQKLDCSTIPLEATAFGSACVQKSPAGLITGDEDCLKLNLWKPATASPSNQKAVMVFIHGGGNMSGSAFTDDAGGIVLYDGQLLAERGDVIVVTLNYRLNIFGYLVDDALAKESLQGVSGNYGILDQIAALQWVKDNIARFGGDPNRVLLFGESGGATDVCALLSSPLAAGLYSSAIFESGSCHGRPTKLVTDWSQAFISRSSCAGSADKLSCLRGLPATEVAAAMDPGSVQSGLVTTPAGPFVDGYVFPEDPEAAFAQGRSNKVPVVVGVNADETAAPLFGVPAMSAGEYSTRVYSLFGDTHGSQVLSRYPATSYPSPKKAFVALTTDWQFVCPARRAARALDRGQTQAVYRYLYTHVMDGPAQALGSAHGLELFYVFQTMSRIVGYAPTSADLALERHVLDYWTRMAKTGSPNGAGAPAWPEFSSDADDYLNLRDLPIGGEGVRTSLCDFWDDMP